jgi:glycine betaine/proline transport system substrate-binding protein
MKPSAEKPGSNRNDISSGIVLGLDQVTKNAGAGGFPASVASSSRGGKARQKFTLDLMLHRQANHAGFPSLSRGSKNRSLAVALAGIWGINVTSFAQFRKHTPYRMSGGRSLDGVYSGAAARFETRCHPSLRRGNVMKLHIKALLTHLACLAAVAGAAVATPPAFAQDPAACRAVHFADIGWTDITSTTALASTVFEGLGYQPVTTVASVPISFAGLKSKQLDVSLGYWWPVQEKAIAPFVDSKSIQVLQPPNLTGAKATFAVPSYEYDAGLKTFADIAKHRDQLDGKIYGIEPGSSANAAIQKMIANNQFGLGGFKLIESSEAGMLVSVDRAIREKKWVVFLGWEPHPMNIQIDMKYLTGSDGVFGPNDGEARVYTLTSPDFLTRCPNAGKLVSNLRFSTQLENVVMQSVMNKEKPADAAKAYLKKNPQVLDAWLAGVKTYDGKDGLPAVKAYLGL